MSFDPTPPRPVRHAARVDGLAEMLVGAGRRVDAFTLSASGACQCGADGAEHNVQVCMYVCVCVSGRVCGR